MTDGIDSLPDTALIFTSGVGGVRYAEAQNTKAYNIIRKFNQLQSLRILANELDRQRKTRESFQKEVSSILERYPLIQQALANSDSRSKLQSKQVFAEARSLFTTIRSRADLLAFFKIVLAPLSQSAQGAKMIFENHDLNLLDEMSLQDFIVTTRPEMTDEETRLSLSPVTTDLSVDETMRMVEIVSLHSRELEAQENTIENFFNGAGFGSW
jgi:hypothetical protein